MSRVAADILDELALLMEDRPELGITYAEVEDDQNPSAVVYVGVWPSDRFDAATSELKGRYGAAVSVNVEVRGNDEPDTD